MRRVVQPASQEKIKFSKTSSSNIKPTILIPTSHMPNHSNRIPIINLQTIIPFFIASYWSAHVLDRCLHYWFFILLRAPALTRRSPKTPTKPQSYKVSNAVCYTILAKHQGSDNSNPNCCYGILMPLCSKSTIKS